MHAGQIVTLCSIHSTIQPCLIPCTKVGCLLSAHRCDELEKELDTLQENKRNLQDAAEKQDCQLNLVSSRLQRKTFQLQQVT
jgi:hypothetical protein